MTRLTDDRISGIRIDISHWAVAVGQHINTSITILTVTDAYAQLMPATLISIADAPDTLSAMSTEPVAASAIAPGLMPSVETRHAHRTAAHNWVPHVGELNADTRPAVAS